MFLGTPRDGVATKINNVISIRESMKIKSGVPMEKNTLINGSTKIPKESFGHMPMISGWTMHKLRKFVDYIYNI